MIQGEVTTQSTPSESALSLPADSQRYLSELSPSHAPMVKHIAQVMPSLRRDIEVFGRRQSQFMDSTLTCSHPTPVRNLRQVLSEIHRAMSALRETVYMMKKRELEAKIKDAEAAEIFGEGSASLKAELLRVEAAELRSHNEATTHGVSGAIRKVRALCDQRDSILKTIGKDHLTEADFEADEARYHVMKAFEQALCAAYSRSGSVDEGNHIYFCQLGISGIIATAEIAARLEGERAMVQGGSNPLPDAHHKWLVQMADKYAGQAARRVELTGMIGAPSGSALLMGGDDHE